MIDYKSYGKFLIDNGLLFEINRKVMHPIGLSFVIDIDSKNKKRLVIVGIDQTDDEEGFLFDEETLEFNKKKYNNFIRKFNINEKLEARKNKLGFIEQE